MSKSGKPRLVWFDANRVFAAMGVVLIHSTVDFGGKPFANAEPAERIFPIFARSVAELSGSEMFFLFSLFLMAMRIDRKLPSYGTAIGQQASRLLVPFAFWAVFYAFFRLLKADAFGYWDYIWNQLSDPTAWLGYAFLGSSQYHLHFLPTLFILFLFYPIMRTATRFPILGLTLFVTLGVMQATQGYVWSLGLDPMLRDFLSRGLKIFGYVGYGFAAFAIYGLWKDGIPRGESKLLRMGAFYFAVLAYIATIPFYGAAVNSGDWGVRQGWDFYGHFLMPIFMFFIFMGGQYRDWSPNWSKLAKYTFGIYLLHPLVIDLFDVGLYKSGLSAMMAPWMIVVIRFPIALAGAYGLARLIAGIRPLAWTIGLGPAPWQRGSDPQAAEA